MDGLLLVQILPPPAHSPFWTRHAKPAREGPKDPKERRQREPGGPTLPACAGLPFSLRPERVRRRYNAISTFGKGGSSLNLTPGWECGEAAKGIGRLSALWLSHSCSPGRAVKSSAWAP